MGSTGIVNGIETDEKEANVRCNMNGKTINLSAIKAMMHRTIRPFPFHVPYSRVILSVSKTVIFMEEMKAKEALI